MWYVDMGKMGKIVQFPMNSAMEEYLEYKQYEEYYADEEVYYLDQGLDNSDSDNGHKKEVCLLDKLREMFRIMCK